MATQTIDIQSDIRKADDAFESTFRQGDAAGIAEFYTLDAMLLPPGSDFVKGKEAIRDFWKKAMDMGIKEAELNILEVELHDDTTIEVGHYKLMGGGKVMDQGKYIVIWKQEGGQWKVHRDMWNNSQPPQ
jgi:uncharacterized protein (TIGR02246 family)